MAALSFEERITIETYLEMGSGYVLDFSNSTFQGYVYEKIKIDVYSHKYANSGDSKAKRLRELFKIEPDNIVGKLLESFVYYYQYRQNNDPHNFIDKNETEKEVIKIAKRLLEGGICTHIDNIKSTSEENDFKKLSKSIIESIEQNEPELALDRLHTFFVKYIRELCNKNSITFVSTDTLNALFGKYVKHIETAYGFESEMTKTILKTSISILERYNDVRNNRSFAHDNKLLNYEESLYIVDTIARLKGFIDVIQQRIEIKHNETKTKQTIISDDFPF